MFGLTPFLNIITRRTSGIATAFFIAWVWLGSGVATSLAGERIYWADVVVDAKPALDAAILEVGRQVYGTRCALCHGMGGLGNGPAAAYLLTKPRDFSEGQFKLRTTMDFPTDEDLFRTITVGFPAYGMPQFDYLSAEARWALVNYVKLLGMDGFKARLVGDRIRDKLKIEPEAVTPQIADEHAEILEAIRKDADETAEFRFEAFETAARTEGVAAGPGAIEKGREVYAQFGCVKCHGETGHGDGPSADGLIDNKGRKIRPRDFALNRWYFKAGDRPGDIVRVLITGMPGTPMPSYDMGPEHHAGLWNLAHYVRSLAALEDKGARGDD